MKNLGRAIRLALRQKFTFAGIVVCSVAVAVFWGASIGAVYPFVEVVFRNKSLHDWADDKLAEADKNVADFRAEIAESQQLADQATSDEARRKHAAQISYLETRIVAEQKSAATTQRLQPYIERYLPDDAFQTLVFIVGFLVVGTTIKCVFLVANMILVQRFAEGTTLALRNQIYQNTLNLELGTFNEERTSDLMNRFTSNISSVGASIGYLAGKALREPLKASVCLIGAAMISWQLMAFSFLTAPVAMLLMYVLAKSLKRANRRAMEEMSQLFGRLSQSFNGIYAVKAYTMEKFETNRFAQTARQVYHKAMKITLYRSLAKSTNEVAGICIVAVSILAGGYLVLNQATHLFGIPMTSRPLSFGGIMLFYAFLIGASDPVRKFSDILSVVQTGAAGADRVFPLLDRQSTITQSQSPHPLHDLRQPLSFDGVDFHYTQDQPVLCGVSLNIAWGETIAFVGPNGCGKTTLANMIPRFYDPVQGDIMLGDVNLRDVGLKDLRDRIGVITQQTILFDDTVMNNIRYGSLEATDAEVVEAARRAHAHPFIEDKLEHGYDTNVGETGGRLSGGQRQRIALARAILRNPDILIMDEATSQVDPESERAIHDALRDFIQDRTTIMITHRASSLSLADRIVVMDKGEIIDIGSHEELASRCALYRSLFEGDLRASA